MNDPSNLSVPQQVCSVRLIRPLPSAQDQPDPHALPGYETGCNPPHKPQARVLPCAQPHSELAQAHMHRKPEVNNVKKYASSASLDLCKPLLHPLLPADKTVHHLKPFLVPADKHWTRVQLFCCSAQSSRHNPYSPAGCIAPVLPPPAPGCTSWPLPDPTTHQGSFLLVAESILVLNSFPQCCLHWLFHPSPVICTQHF